MKAFSISLAVLVSFVLVAESWRAVHAQGTGAVAERSFEIPETDEGLAGEGPIRRYDWFRNLWRQRRSRWAEQVEQDRGSVVFFGDSITQGWGDDFKQQFADMKSANRGISGDTTRGMLIRLEEDVLVCDPAAVVMLMGTNDLDEGASPEMIVANIGRIVERLGTHDSSMPIVLCQVMPSSAEKNRPAEKIKRVNELLARSVRGNRQVTVIDTWTLFADEQGDAKPQEFPDLLHPNDVGYAKWAGALRPVFETLGLMDVAADDFVPEEGFVSLFNGKDLTGWGYLPTTEAMLAVRERVQSRSADPPAWPVVTKAVAFDGKTTSDDGRYVIRNGRIVVLTPTEGRSIQQMWTTESFPEDFTLRLEFRATPNADSGVFLREPQLQCRDYLLAGPYKQLQKYKPLDWNLLEVVVRGNVAHCTCNGEVLEASLTLPETGPIGLEGDRGQMEYRRIRIRQD